MLKAFSYRALAVGLCIGLGLWAGAAQAALLNSTLAAPTIAYDSGGTMTFDASSGALNVDATPLAILFADSSLAFVDAPRSMQIRLLVNGGAASSNGDSDDLMVQGSIDADGDGNPDYSGTLLTGKIVAFGYEYTGTTVSSFDYIFAVTGGSMAGSYPSGYVGVTQTSENSTFTGSFAVNFAGQAKGNIGLLATHAITGHVTCTDTATPMSDVVVAVLDSNNNPVGGDTTQADGSFLVGDLLPGVYTVTVTVPADAKSCGQTSMAVTVPADQDAAVEFCVCPCASSSIKGTVAATANTTTYPVPDVTITAYDSNNTVVGTATTGPDGTYVISNLAPATYTVTMTVPPLFEAIDTTSETVSLACEQEVTIDFRLKKEPITDCPTKIVGKVTAGDLCKQVVVPDAVIEVLDANNQVVATETTAEDGTFSVSDLPVGDYQVVITAPDGYEVCGSATVSVTLTCGQTATANFKLSATCPPATISGTVKAGWCKPVEGVTVKVYDYHGTLKGSDTTDADGNYTISGLHAGAYVVKMEVPAGYKSCDTCESVFVWCGQTRAVNFYLQSACQPAAVTGTVTCGCKGISGVTIEAYDSNNSLKGSATTGCGGTYTISNLPAGSYTIKMTVPSGYAAGGNTSVSVQLYSGQTQTVNFCLQQNCPATVTGSVTCGCKGISGVTISAYDSNNNLKGSDTTGCGGTYTISNLPAGSYTIKMTVPSGYKASGSTSVSVTLYSGHTQTVNFCLQQSCPATVSGSVKCCWKGVSGVTVSAYDSCNRLKGSDTTGWDGSYSICNLPAGNYTIKMTLPCGYGAYGCTSTSVSLCSGQTQDVDFNVYRK